MVRFSCPTCGQHFAGDETYYGRQVSCPACRNSFVVPPVIPTTRAAPAAPGHYPPNTLPPKKRNTALVVIAAVLAFLLSAGAAFFVVQRLLAPQVVAVANMPANAAGKLKGAPGKIPQRSADDESVGQLSAADIIQHVNDAYGALTSYSSEGTAVTDMDMSKMDIGSLPGVSPQIAARAKASKEAQAALAKPQHLESDFSVKLARPGLYRIDWNSQKGPMKMSGAAWSTGDEHYIYMGMQPPKYVKMQSREMALGAATGVSQGAANTIPMFFFNGKQSMLNMMENVTLGKEEAVDGTDCYLVNGDLRGMKLNLWIDKSSFLIKQKQQVFGGDVKMPEMSDKDVDAAIKQLGDGGSEAKRAQVKAMMKNMKAMTSKMKGTMTETYRNIETNQKISTDKFKFDVPEGVELSGSLF